MSSRTASKKPSYDDDFDSDVDEDDDEISVVGQVNAPPSRPSRRHKAKIKMRHPGVDDEEETDDDEEEEDSDFEDPDEIEVPGGGKSLEIIQNLKDPVPGANPSTSKAGGSGSLLKKSAMPAVASTADDDDDISIVEEVPGQPRVKPRRPPFMGQPGSRGRMGPAMGGRGGYIQGMGGRALPNYSALGGSSTGRDPFIGSMLANAGGATSRAGLDILQKSMQNGGLSSLMSNPFSMGGAGMSGMSGLMKPGTSGSGSLLGQNQGNPFQGLSKNQINSLWGMGGSSGAAGGATGSVGGMYSGSYGGLMSAAAFARDQQEDEEVAAEDEDDMGVIETYSNYKPSKLTIGQPHPDPVVETASLASVEPPDVWYKLALPSDVIDEGKLSALQLETVTYASQQHEQILRDGNRAGFLVGDGAGVGKGRTIAGIIYENYIQGRKRAVWVSVSNDLKYDAERDLSDIGADIDVHFLSKMKYAKINSAINNNVKKGVIYATYSALIGESQGGESKYKTRLKQLLHWCGEDFDGCVIFDECHRAKNLCPSTGAGKPTKTGQTVLELQQKLPNARVVYASATGASEPKHMAYMVRLGIWGKGSPFRDFSEFLGAVEKRGVGAMEIVAMDMKLRGMYIARQLSFAGVGFRVDEVELLPDMRKTYNAAVDLWVELMHKFEEAAALVDADKKIRKTMWGQFWSSHQRFFKYLCIASKVPHVINVANEVIKLGKCVVIGLQSTGEARTLEVVEKEEELTDFVSTAKGVLHSLVEKHFPAPDRSKIDRILGRQRNIFEELGIDKPKPLEPLGKRKAKNDASSKVSKKTKYEWDEEDSDGGNEHEGSDYDADDVDEDDEFDEDDDDFIDDEEEDVDEEDYNPFGTDSEDEDNPWARRGQKESKKNKKVKKAKAAPKKNGQSKVNDHVAMLLKQEKKSSNPRSLLNGSVSNGNGNGNGNGTAFKEEKPVIDKVDRACQMREDIMAKISRLGQRLPANTLDQLIDELGGPSNVSEMTGRKGRVVADEVSGEVRYESRSVGNDVPLETLNLCEKDKFMRGEKDVAIISEAASSGISLQADRRVQNQRRRVHMTLELPWSADRAIQQFGRTHRSNQVSAPEYVLLISDLAGEHRFASIVAKRLESLGALTHGDRRAGESRDLSRFNIDNKYGRTALETVFKAIMGYETPLVKPPADYKGDFFKDIADGLVGVGLITNSEDMPGMLTLDKGHSDMSKFLNRILGMHVEKQNMLFKYFSDTLNAIINQAKRAGKYDQGILDVGLTEEDKVELVRTHTFIRKHSTGKAKIELHVLTVERGLSWDASKEKWTELIGEEEGYYVSHNARNGKKAAILAVMNERSSKYKALSDSSDKKNKKKDKVYIVYRPNTGQQVKQETLAELKKKYRKVSPDEAEPHWNEQFKSSVKKCSHAYWRGNCKNASMGTAKCEIGLRRKTYNVLAGSVLSVWAQVEAVLTHDGNRKGTNSRMQVVRLKLENNKRIVGTLIPNSAMTALLTALDEGSEGKGETIY